jgi:hypothetical protein
MIDNHKPGEQYYTRKLQKIVCLMHDTPKGVVRLGFGGLNSCTSPTVRVPHQIKLVRER